MHEEIYPEEIAPSRVSRELITTTISLRSKKMRLRAIFLRLRKFKIFESISDIGLLTGIVNSLKLNYLSLSKKETYSAFQLVDKNEYEMSQKRLILKDLLNGAERLSVFTPKNNLGKLND